MNPLKKLFDENYQNGLVFFKAAGDFSKERAWNNLDNGNAGFLFQIG